MNIAELKLSSLNIDKNKFGRVFSFVDFGNVNYWYHKDERDWENNILKPNERLIIDIKKLGQFLDLFSEHKRFYYGWHQRVRRSWHIMVLAEKNGFVKVTKPIQFIKHYLNDLELNSANGRFVMKDIEGKYIEIPKSNFDVEISVDSIRLLDNYDTFCLLSGDSDFAHLARFLKRRGKKIIVMASGQVFHSLKDIADLYINAQKIKADITSVKKKTPPD